MKSTAIGKGTASTGTDRSRRMSKADRRRQLINCALELFSEKGFAETTTKAIASTAGVSEGIIYHHFPTKEELHSSILDHISKEGNTEQWLAELRGHAEQDEDEALVRSVVSKILDSYRTNRAYHRMMLFASLRGHEIAQLANERLNLPVFEFLRDYVSRRQSEGSFRKGDPGLIVLGLVSMPVYYSLITRLFGGSVADLDRPDEVLVPFFTALVLEGLRAREPAGALRADGSLQPWQKGATDDETDRNSSRRLPGSGGVGGPTFGRGDHR